MHVRDSMKQLPEDFDDLFFFKDFEFHFQVEQRFLSELHDEVNIRWVAVEMVQWNEIVMVQWVLYFDLIFQLFNVFLRMGSGNGFLSIQEFSGLLLNEIDKWMGSNSDRFDSEEETLGLMFWGDGIVLIWVSNEIGWIISGWVVLIFLLLDFFFLGLYLC